MTARRPKRKRVKFALQAPHAREVTVLLVAENGKEERIDLRKTGEGTWEKTRLLQPGRYSYRFLVNGEVPKGSAESWCACMEPGAVEGEIRVYFAWTQEI